MAIARNFALSYWVGQRGIAMPSLVERSAFADASRELADSMSFGFGRSALGFWVASLVGFVSYGYLVAGLAMSGMEDGPGRLGEATTPALVLGLVGALTLGAPAALLFGGVMWRVRRGAGWFAALSTGVVLSAVLYLPFRSLAAAIVADWGYTRQPVIFLVASAAAMMAGAVTGALVGRNGRELAVATRCVR
jgi:hypothetical protein